MSENQELKQNQGLKLKPVAERLESETTSQQSAVNSPVTDLTLNLQILNTGAEQRLAARRKLRLFASRSTPLAPNSSSPSALSAPCSFTLSAPSCSQAPSAIVDTPPTCKNNRTCDESSSTCWRAHQYRSDTNQGTDDLVFSLASRAACGSDSSVVKFDNKRFCSFDHLDQICCFQAGLDQDPLNDHPLKERPLNGHPLNGHPLDEHPLDGHPGSCDSVPLVSLVTHEKLEHQVIDSPDCVSNNVNKTVSSCDIVSKGVSCWGEGTILSQESAYNSNSSNSQDSAYSSCSSSVYSSQQSYDQTSSINEGCSVDEVSSDFSSNVTGMQLDDSPFLFSMESHKNLAPPVQLRRLQSLPLPFRGFDSTPSPQPCMGGTEGRSEVRSLSRACKSDTSALESLRSPLDYLCVPEGHPLSQDKENIGSSTALVKALFKLPVKKPPRERALVDSTNRRLALSNRSISLVDSSANQRVSAVNRSVSLVEHVLECCEDKIPSHSSFDFTLTEDSEFSAGFEPHRNVSEPTTDCPKSLGALFFSPVLDSLASAKPVSNGSSISPVFNLSALSCGSNTSSVSPVSNGTSISPCGLFRTPSAPSFGRMQAGARRAAGEDRQRYKRTDREREKELSPGLGGKKRKSRENDDDDDMITSSSRMHRCHSEAEIMIKKALSCADNRVDLIGDFSKPCCLPLIIGRHPDLKTISAHTLASMLNGDFDEILENFVVIDSRYPYEFNGGHIKGAKNYYMKEEIIREFFESDQHRASSTTQRRTVFIFHCEFSSQRGPELSRFLRNKDRDIHMENYPQLFYPELYLLEGGYKSFYELHPHLCTPGGYLPMLHENHADDLKHFRAKANSWVNDKSKGARTNQR